MPWASPPAKRVFLVSHDGAHVFVNNLPSIMKEYVTGSLTSYQIHLLMIEDGTADNAAVPLSQACLLAEHLRALHASQAVRVDKGLSSSAVCYQMGKLVHTLTPLDYVFVVTDSPELRKVIDIPATDNLVFISPSAIARVTDFERLHADVLFHSRFNARCARRTLARPLPAHPHTNSLLMTPPALYDFDIFLAFCVAFTLSWFFDRIVFSFWFVFKKSVKWSVCYGFAAACVLGFSFASPNYRRVAQRVSHALGSGKNYLEHFM
jgi:hypothetical protein